MECKNCKNKMEYLGEWEQWCPHCGTYARYYSNTPRVDWKHPKNLDEATQEAESPQNLLGEVVRLHNMTPVQLYKELVSIVRKHGEHKPKKHGEWVKLQYTKDVYFNLDTWSDALSIQKGKGEYCYWLGFGKNDEYIYIGIDFGGCNVHQTKDMLLFWLDGIRRTISA